MTEKDVVYKAIKQTLYLYSILMAFSLIFFIPFLFLFAALILTFPMIVLMVYLGDKYSHFFFYRPFRTCLILMPIFALSWTTMYYFSLISHKEPYFTYLYDVIYGRPRYYHDLRSEFYGMLMISIIVACVYLSIFFYHKRKYRPLTHPHIEENIE